MVRDLPEAERVKPEAIDLMATFQNQQESR